MALSLSENIIIANRYQLKKRLGNGSFGEVWLADDMLASIPVAVKFYGTLDDSGITEFRKEYQIAYSLNHPNLLHINQFDVFENCPCLVMPYCQQGSVANKTGKLTETEVWEILRDISNGLSYLHEQTPAIIHQDIKPDNILISNEGHYVISDFGVSKKVTSTFIRSKSSEQVSSGTLAYMGPEHFSAENIGVSCKTDIWALGMTIYELVTGDVLWNGQGGCAQVNGAQIPYNTNNVSSELSQILNACLRINPTDRPSAQELFNYSCKILSNDRRLFNNVDNSHIQYASDPVGNASYKLPESSKKSIERFSWIKVASICAFLFVAFLIVMGAISVFRSVTENNDFVDCKTLEDYRHFIEKYPDSERKSFVLGKIKLMEQNNAVTIHPQNVQQTIEKNNAKASQTPRHETIMYKEKSHGKDQQIEKNTTEISQDQVQNQTEYNTFAACQTIDDYIRYLSSYPKGVYYNEARARIAQIEQETNNSRVQENNEHIPSTRVNYTRDTETIRNSTIHRPQNSRMPVQHNVSRRGPNRSGDNSTYLRSRSGRR